MLRVDLRPSRQLALALIAAHAGAAVTTLPLDVPAAAKIGLVLLIAASLGRALYRHAWLKSRGSVTAIELRDHDRATVETRCGDRLEVRVLGTTYVSAMLCVMNMRAARRPFACHAVIVRDNVDAEAFRKLRVRLRWGYGSDGLTV
jgi:toxin CptA